MSTYSIKGYCTKNRIQLGEIPFEKIGITIHREGSFVPLRIQNLQYIYIKDEAWDTKLNEQLEISERYLAIENQMDIAPKNLALFNDLHLHKNNNTLEWIIIWLIVIEVIHMMIEQILLPIYKSI